MDATDLVRYNLAVRGLYFEALEKITWEEAVKPHGLSFDSARNVFVHLTLVEDRWINFILQNRFSEWRDPDFESYQDFASLKEYMLRVRNCTEQFLENLKPYELKRKVTIPWGDKPGTRIALETALSHMVMEDMVHYGELSALLWQMNMEAPYLAFWRYKYNLAETKNKKKAF
jgi:uncharacterized damage-inducible protein DinB